MKDDGYDPKEFAAQTAKVMAKRMTDAYVASVIAGIDSYTDDYLPDEDDFFAWVEGYDWT